MSEGNGHFDLDAKRAARLAAARESAHEQYSFTFGGREFHMLAAKEWPANTKRLLDDSDLAALLDLVIDDPPAFWATKPTMADVEDLIADHGRWSGAGADLPESSGSPPAVSTPT